MSGDHQTRQLDKKYIGGHNCGGKALLPSERFIVQKTNSKMVRLTDTRIVVYFTHGTVLETAVGENIFLVVFQPGKTLFPVFEEIYQG